MEKTVSATKAVRNFSEILNSIKYRGNSYTIVKSGKPVASLCPVETHPRRERTLQELKGLLKELPRLGDDGVSFEDDIREIVKAQPSMLRTKAWG